MPCESVEERRPLLDSHASADTDEAHNKTAIVSRGRRVFQLALLAFWRSCHPLWFGFIFPIIADLILDNNIAQSPKDVGFYAGWIESAYSCAVLVGLYPASVLSDTWGRNSTIILGITGGAIATILFGFARSFLALLVLRFAIGLSISLTAANALTVLIELSTKETQSLHVALNQLGWSTGETIAPFIGALTAKPADKIRWLKGSILDKFPFALPSLVVSFLPLLSVIPGLLYGAETRPGARQSPLQRSQYGTVHRPSITAGTFTRPMIFALASWFIMIAQLQATAITEVLALSRPTSIGGFQLSPSEIAIVLGARSLADMLVPVPLYGVLGPRLGPRTIARIFSSLMPVVNLFYLALSRYSKRNPNHMQTFEAVGFISIFEVMSQPAYSAIMEIIASRAPTRAHLSRANTAAEFVGNAGHGLGVLLGGQFCALALKYDLLQGDAAWLFPIALGTITWVACLKLTEEPGWREVDEAMQEDGSAAAAIDRRTIGQVEEVFRH